ncbi:MAG: hypothetical protein IT362_07695 [Deltaproteobacteria bacterium]|nr:hypothetical protein [Deltaproteobacteria bacterium]
MKKAFILGAGFFLVFASLSLADDGQKEEPSREARDEGAVTYRATSSAVEIEASSCGERPKKIFTKESQRLWVEHEADTEGCADVDGPDEKDGLEGR